MANSQGLLRRILSKGKTIGAQLSAGQAIHATHPELIASNELTPGILASEYAARREALVSSIPPSSVAILPAAFAAFMTGHIPYPYRQDADVMYLTGVAQPHTVAVFGGPDSPAPGYTLFVPDPDNHGAKWDGARIDADAAIDVFGADEAFPMSQVEPRLSKIVSGSHRVLYDTDRGGLLHLAVASLRSAVEQMRVTPLRSALHSLRWRKSTAEVDLMRQSATAAAQGLRRCMALSQPGVTEHRLAAAFEYECKMRGAQRMAYPSVVAGGSSSTIIHYNGNNKVVRGGELLLMDAGCERHGYASDVTRTWPVSGRFTPEQRAVYEVVLQIHRDCLHKCRLGTSLRDIHQHSIKLVSQGIADLRLLPGQLATSIARDAYREFYPHSLGHWLGMDTHDVATQSQDKLLQPGVVMIVEPGLYIPDEPRFGKFAGIGVRIEDDVAITGHGPEVLSKSVPTAPDEIEELVGTAAEEERRKFLRPALSIALEEL